SSQRVRRGVYACHRACEFAIREAVNAEPHALSFGDVADVVGRHQSFETQAGGVDDLDQLLADGGRVTRRHLAIADDAVERRAHFGAFELLARGHDTRVRSGAIALRGIAANLHVLELPGGNHAGL